VAKLASGTLAPEAFLASFVVGTVIDFAVSLIPEDYEGLIGYQCRRCGHRGTLSDFDGCITLICQHCKRNRAKICFRNVSFDLSFAE